MATLINPTILHLVAPFTSIGDLSSLIGISRKSRAIHQSLIKEWIFRNEHHDFFEAQLQLYFRDNLTITLETLSTMLKNCSLYDLLELSNKVENGYGSQFESLKKLHHDWMISKLSENQIVLFGDYWINIPYEESKPYETPLKTIYNIYLSDLCAWLNDNETNMLSKPRMTIKKETFNFILRNCEKAGIFSSFQSKIIVHYVTNFY